jgi:hypothetical protein
MPWVRRQPRTNNKAWALAILAAAGFGVFLGYERWGSTAAVVEVVERELSATESHIADLENRMLQLEAKLASRQADATAADDNSGAATNQNEVRRASTKRLLPRAENYR